MYEMVLIILIALRLYKMFYIKYTLIFFKYQQAILLTMVRKVNSTQNLPQCRIVCKLIQSFQCLHNFSSSCITIKKNNNMDVCANYPLNVCVECQFIIRSQYIVCFFCYLGPCGIQNVFFNYHIDCGKQVSNGFIGFLHVLVVTIL